MNATTHERLYTVASNPPYFYTGRLANGTQLLMGIQPPDFVLVEFDIHGNYLRVWGEDNALGSSGISQHLVEPKADETLVQLQSWQTKLGIKHDTILIKKFFLPERWIGIKELPEHYQEVLDEPDTFTLERQKQLNDDIRLWNDAGSFVLYWDEDYYLNREGEIESS